MTVHDFTYTGGTRDTTPGVTGVEYEYRAKEYADLAVQSYRDARFHAGVAKTYRFETSDIRDHVDTVADTITSSVDNARGHAESALSSAVSALDSAESAHTSAEIARGARDMARVARTGAQAAETTAQQHATGAAASASSAAEILEATQDLGITVDTSVGIRVFVGDTMIHGDTGWRIIDLEGEVSGQLYVKRFSNFVDLFFYNVETLRTGSRMDLINVPNGFRSSFRFNPYEQALVFTTPLIGHPEIRRVSTFGNLLRLYNPTRGEVLTGHVTYLTSDDWPTTLPGTSV